MPIPDLFSITLPMLRIMGDEQEHELKELVEAVSRVFNLTDDERAELLPTGNQTRIKNRVGWARVELILGGLIESTGRARVRITERGKAVLSRSPERIDRGFLKQFPEYLKKLGSAESGPSQIVADQQGEQTPLETIESGYRKIRRELAGELLESIHRCSPRFFEQLVIDLLVAMGYGGSRSDAAQAVGKSGDGGIDGIIKEDRLGLDVVYVQAKRWEGNVGRPAVQGFAGSLEGRRAKKGILITTSGFTQDAKQYVEHIERGSY